jgi:hypothetical protein
MSFEALVKGVSDLYDNDTGGFAPSPPLTNTASSHSISIKTNKGIKIGRIQSWAPQMSRTVDAIYEVQLNNRGEPAERIPQAQTTNSISIDRYELYSLHIGEAFGIPVLGDNTDLTNLTLQTKPIHVREMWRDPFGTIRAYGYFGCWFSSLGLTIAANDDRIIKSRATLEFTRKIRIA